MIINATVAIIKLSNWCHRTPTAVTLLSVSGRLEKLKVGIIAALESITNEIPAAVMETSFLFSSCKWYYCDYTGICFYVHKMCGVMCAVIKGLKP
jgi:hypothetical protein